MKGTRCLAQVSVHFCTITRVRASEIPCRVSNIARDDGNIVPTTGSNRWNPHDVSCRDVTGNTEGKIRSNPNPRNDSGVEIPGWPQGHNTPALMLTKR